MRLFVAQARLLVCIAELPKLLAEDWWLCYGNGKDEHQWWWW